MSLSATLFGNKTTEDTVSWDESMLEQSGPSFNETGVLTETRNSDKTACGWVACIEARKCKMPATQALPYHL